MSFLCDRCGICCKTHRVPVTLADVRRLRANKNRLPSSYLELLDPEQLDLEGEPECVLSLREGRRILCLAQKRADGQHGCVFLTEGGCSTHHSRPLACRTYPFDRPEKEDARALDVVPNYVCPTGAGVKDTLAFSMESSGVSGFRAAIENRDRELADFAWWVRRMNRRSRVRIQLGRLPPSEKEIFRMLNDDTVLDQG